MDLGWKTRKMVKAFSVGKMAVNMMECGNQIKCQVKENYITKKEQSMKGYSKMAKSMVKVFTLT